MWSSFVFLDKLPSSQNKCLLGPKFWPKISIYLTFIVNILAPNAYPVSTTTCFLDLTEVPIFFSISIKHHSSLTYSTRWLRDPPFHKEFFPYSLIFMRINQDSTKILIGISSSDHLNKSLWAKIPHMITKNIQKNSNFTSLPWNNTINIQQTIHNMLDTILHSYGKCIIILIMASLLFISSVLNKVYALFNKSWYRITKYFGSYPYFHFYT